MNNVSSSNSQKALVPELRFPEFTDGWKTDLIGNIGSFTKGGGLSKADITENGTPFILYGELYTTYGDVIYDIKRKTDKAVSEECYSKVGDVIIPTSGETPEEIATSACVMVPDVILAGDLNILRSNNIDGRFLSYLINHVANRSIAKIAQGKSVVHIQAKEISKIAINFPSSAEQLRIVNLLELLDAKISKQEDLIESLKLYKRGVLSSLFEQKVSFVKDSNWTTKSLGDVFTERTERATGNEELLSVTINDGIQKREELDSKDNSSENKSNYKKVYVDDIAYNTMRMWQGASGHSPFNGIVSPAYTVIKLNDKDNHSIKFWSFYFKHIPLIKTFQKFSQGLTSDTWNLKYPQLAQIRVSYPSYDEQQKIVSILETIDTKILAEEKSLENLVLYKKQLLQKMFI